FHVTGVQTCALPIARLPRVFVARRAVRIEDSNVAVLLTQLRGKRPHDLPELRGAEVTHRRVDRLELLGVSVLQLLRADAEVPLALQHRVPPARAEPPRRVAARRSAARAPARAPGSIAAVAAVLGPCPRARGAAGAAAAGRAAVRGRRGGARCSLGRGAATRGDCIWSRM